MTFNLHYLSAKMMILLQTADEKIQLVMQGMHRFGI